MGRKIIMFESRNGMRTDKSELKEFLWNVSIIEGGKFILRHLLIESPLIYSHKVPLKKL